MDPREDIGLDESMLSESPFAQLDRWRSDAREAQIIEPNAMCVATVGSDGRPSARFVLLRGLDERGLVFFTNYESRKGQELADRPFAAATFWWAALERQVRVEGDVERTSAKESDMYFVRRQPESRLGSAASPQSRPVQNRAELEGLVEALRLKYPDGDVPRPPQWGGFRIVPHRFEFWQGRPARVHDRLVYVREGDGWRIVRLAP